MLLHVLSDVIAFSAKNFQGVIFVLEVLDELLVVLQLTLELALVDLKLFNLAISFLLRFESKGL